MVYMLMPTKAPSTKMSTQIANTAIEREPPVVRPPRVWE